MREHTFTHCTATEEWSGEYPYSSACLFTVRDKLGGIIIKWRFTTDINPRGESTLEQCLRWCKYYIPKNAKLEEVIDYLVKEGYDKKDLYQVIDEGKKAVEFFSSRRPYISSKAPHMRSLYRQEWRYIYKERKLWRELGKSLPHLLLYRLHGVKFDYLHLEE